MSLIVKETIEVHTDCGVREIQLCLGDITCLPESEKVDIIMVSSFPGSYSATPGTVIGALWRRYKLSVNQLARKKAEDLRKHFHCWTSQDLPSHLPYRRLLCFEKSTRQTLQGVELKQFEIVGEVFRALSTTLFNEQDRSVITPLLATGCQNTQKWKMLRAMVNSCLGWMRAGLPLSCMKVVIYQSNPNSNLHPDDQKAVDQFHKLKKQIEAEMKHITFTIEYDLYMSYALPDKERVDDFMKRLKKKFKSHSTDSSSSTKKEDGKVQELKMICHEIKDQGEQILPSVEKSSSGEEIETMRQNMLRSNRVLIFLSPTFMKVNSGEGIEEYNLALCLSQLTRRDILQPVYLHTIPDLPMYMAMTQWIDCRTKESDTVDLETKVMNAVDNLCKMLTDKSADDITSPAKLQSSKAVSHYDVFLSYSHRDTQIANIFLRSIKDLCPSAKIFYDRDEIKSGFSWQATLYTALSNSRVILALISPSYISSLVCREEFAIALTQHLSNQYSTVLLPVCISEDLIHCLHDPQQKVEIHSIFSPLPFLVPYMSQKDAEKFPSKISAITLTAAACYLAEQITKKVDSLDQNRTLVYTPATEPMAIEHILGKARYRWFNRKIMLTEKSGSVTVQIVDKREKNRGEFLSKRDQQPSSEEEDEEASAAAHIKSPAESKQLEVKRITISHHDNDKLPASLLEAKIKEFLGKDVEVTLVNHTQEVTGIEMVQQAQIIICLLNTIYVTTSSTLHHLHIGISKHRQCSAVLVPVILEHLPSKPSFLHLIPARFATFDIHTTKLPTRYPFKSNYHQILKKFSKIPPSPTPLPPPLPHSVILSSGISKKFPHGGGGGDTKMSAVKPILERTDSVLGLSLHVEVMLNMVAQWIAEYLISNLHKEHKSPIIRAITDFEKEAFRKPKHFQLKQENFCYFEIPSESLDKFYEKISHPETSPHILFRDSPAMAVRSSHATMRKGCDDEEASHSESGGHTTASDGDTIRSASSSMSSSSCDLHPPATRVPILVVSDDDTRSSSSEEFLFEHVGASIDRWWEDCQPIKPKLRLLDSQLQLQFPNL